MDLLAAVAERRLVRLAPGARAQIPTGLVLELPPGFEAQVRPRSGLALRQGITVLNSPGTIDCDYRGEVKVLLVNLGEANFVIERGERIAQLAFQRVERASLVEIAVSFARRRRARRWLRFDRQERLERKDRAAASPRKACGKVRALIKPYITNALILMRSVIPSSGRRATALSPSQHPGAAKKLQ